MSRQAVSGQTGGPSLLPLAAGIALLSIFAAFFVVATDGRLGYDDATYLERGLYHANQVVAAGELPLLRLPWSLRFEIPRPPALHGLVAVAALALGRGNLEAILVAGTVVPVVLLLIALAVSARSAVPGGDLWAIAIAASCPLILDIGSRLFVETLLAAAVVAGVAALQRRLSGGGVGAEIAVGLAAGVAALTKVLAPIFVVPAMLIGLWELGRREGYAKAARLAAVAGASAVAVAGLWYQRNFGTALEFAGNASAHWASAYLGPAWRRPVDFLLEGPGPLVGLAFAALAIGSARPAAGAPVSLVFLRRVAFFAGLLPAVVIASRPVFEVRYWVPGLAVLAAWAGAELKYRCEGLERRAVAILPLGAVLCFGFAIHGLAKKPRPATAWSTISRLERLASERPAPVRLCVLGNNPEWNAPKLSLFVEASNVRPRFKVSDLLNSFEGPSVAATFERCDLVFALPAEAVPPVASQQRHNHALAESLATLAASGEFEAREELPAFSVSGFRVRLWERSRAAGGSAKD